MTVRRQQGFTLLEVLFAMTILTTVILLMTTVFVGINRSFSRGMLRKELSEVSQKLADDMTRALRTYGTSDESDDCSSLPSGYDQSFRIGAVSYIWSSSGGLRRSNAACSQVGEQVFGERFILRQLRVTEITSIPGQKLYRLQGVITSGSNASMVLPASGSTWIDDTNVRCRSGQPVLGNCSIEKFNYVVSGRSQL